MHMFMLSGPVLAPFGPEKRGSSVCGKIDLRMISSYSEEITGFFLWCMLADG